tara:strand:- start:2084 stop:2692 length:609 start_codon:yes stop_codon:yes gene_type:complete
MIEHKRLARLVSQAYDKSEFSAYGIGYNIHLDGDTPIVAIQGTNEARDVFTDARFIPGRSELGLVPRGFLFAARSVGISLLANLLKKDKSSQQVKEQDLAICGHSLGAGVAQIVAGFLTWTGNPPKQCVAFAPPRVGKLKGLLDQVPDATAYRFHNDIVCGVPLIYRRPVSLSVIGSDEYPSLGRFRNHSMINYQLFLENNE